MKAFPGKAPFPSPADGRGGPKAAALRISGTEAFTGPPLPSAGEGERAFLRGGQSPEARLALAARLWGWIPHPGQRELLTLRLPDGTEPRVLVAACGRRWGKTEALGCDIATRILTDPDLIQMGVAPTVDQAATLMESVEEKLREAQENPDVLREFGHLADLEFRRAPYPFVRNKRTRQVVFSCRTVGVGGRNLRGKGTNRKAKRFRVIVDERGYVDDEAVERAIKPMLATVAGGGGQLVEIGSPNGRRGGFFRDFEKGERQEGRYRAVRLPSRQNPLVDGEFLAEMRAEMTDAAFRTEFEAEFLDGAGAVFPAHEIAAAVCPDDYGSEPLWGVRYVAGVDFARRGDWTVCAVLAITSPVFAKAPFPSPAAGEGGLYRASSGVKEGERGCCDGRVRPPSPAAGKGEGAFANTGALRLVALYRMQGLGYAAQVEKLADLLDHWNVRRVAPDRTGVGDAVCESLAQALMRRRRACEVEEFVFTQSSKTTLIDGLSLRLGREQLRFPAHPALLSELRNFVATVSGDSGGGEKLAAQTGHDDCVCALALAVAAAAPFLTRADSGGAPGAGLLKGGGPRRRYGGGLSGERSGGDNGGEEREWRWSLTGGGDVEKTAAAAGRQRRGLLPGFLPVLRFAYRFALGRRVGAFLCRRWRGRRA